MPHNQPPLPGRYIDLLNDFGFKKIFGSEPNKDLLIAFLNEVFRGRKHIADLTYNATEQPGDDVTERSAIFDLTCTGADGEVFIIEMQRAWQPFFKDRALYYTSRLISNQAPKGNLNHWRYELKEVYMVALLEQFRLEGVPEEEYLHHIALCFTDTGKVFYNKLGYTYMELSKFDKQENELAADIDKWLYVLKNISQMDKLPVFLRKPIFEKLFRLAEYANLTKEERTMYDNIVKASWDNQNIIEGAELIGEMKGEKRKALEIAREMKKEGLPLEQIARFTKLSVEEIEQL
jgi:predicted transposase/invertase (TIGR01784 family)